MKEDDDGIHYINDPDHEYEIFISSDDKMVKLQRKLL